MGGDKNPATKYEGGSTYEGWKMGGRRGFDRKNVKFYPTRCKVMYRGKQGRRDAEEGEEQKDEGAAERLSRQVLVRGKTEH